MVEISASLLKISVQRWFFLRDLRLILFFSWFEFSADLQGRSDGGYIGIYTPRNQSTLNFFMWLFCLLDPWFWNCNN